MKNCRIPIALRVFVTVLMTTLVIITVSLGVLHWTMQRSFTKYVADVELQKLGHLNENLAGVYQAYHDWGNAIQAQILQIEGEAAPDDYDKLSQWWLRRQYDIALQQRYFYEHSYVEGDAPEINNTALLDQQDLKVLKENLPSEYRPFEGLKFPLSANQNFYRTKFKDRPRNTEPEIVVNHGGKLNKRIIAMPDQLGLSSRLSLYDANKNFIVGERSDQELSYQPIWVDGKIVGYLGLKSVLGQDDALSINFFSNQKRYLFLVYILTFLVSLVAALVLATYFKKPIQRLLNAARELTQGNYQHQVKINRNDELGDLSNEINQLAEILDQHERSRKQWVADTSHELKTPLAVLQAQIEAMQDGIRKASPEHLEAMMRQVMSLKKLTQDLAALAQADAQQLTCYLAVIDPWEVIVQEVDNFRLKFEKAQIEIRLDGSGAQVLLDRDRFKQIIVNLLANSERYTETGGIIHLHTEQTQTQWTLYVDDSPYGLSDDQLAQLGKRFYRVDDSRTRSTGGTGLGLALSLKIVQALGGHLVFEHSPLGGLRCKLTFQKNNGVE
ncbi:sensor histidine kinase efflux regulator BaeS [Acinetobacter rudis]|uniref:histidine kinase n=2 Tax=Acinetobacter rudis TaxID=632955 RepID=A0AAW8J619_9GAMM|nr:sensor histidine kinase efflux regulator BaeS [Acinetobacter rudis]MDQ8935517.1 sensor histidine kinase efflux regulator BaeS [Acinetobacter rudis]MDQ8953591.1 sensor histidine kinase efflux regulator BaeS [Acinetobacter rudis]MDQ9017716.1 sensor histidine kinase efflux regulator BaeS [Acinetobacter rudis]